MSFFWEAARASVRVCSETQLPVAVVSRSSKDDRIREDAAAASPGLNRMERFQRNTVSATFVLVVGITVLSDPFSTTSTHARPAMMDGGIYHHAMVALNATCKRGSTREAAAEHSPKPPEAELSNGVLHVRFYLPDAERGYYRGTRFDWSGVIPSLKYKGHEYFGEWFQNYDPKVHDAIVGPVEEFKSGKAFTAKETSPGYEEAGPGQTFVRLGVGAVRRPQDGDHYEWDRTYEIVDPGVWTVRRGKNWIEFRHELGHSSGYAYIYTKRVRLVPGRPQLVIDHTLRNTGRRTLDVEQYNHNLFVIDGRPTGPDTVVRFPFEPKAEPQFHGPAAVRGHEILYSRELQAGEEAYTIFSGFGTRAKDYDFRIENYASRAGVRIRGDRPLAELQFWSIRTTLCPEGFIALSVKPGHDTKWSLRYDFYELPPGRLEGAHFKSTR
jgi:hypothetical protein